MDGDSDNDDNNERVSDWEEDEEDKEDVIIIDLFSNQIFNSLDLFLIHFQKEYSINLIDLIKEINTNEVAIIMTINYIRYLNKIHNQSIDNSSQLTTQKINEITELIKKKEYIITSSEGNKKI